MKLNQALVSLSIAAATASVATATVASSHEGLKEDNLLPTLLTHKSADRILQVTDLSRQCSIDTGAMETNATYISGMSAVWNHVHRQKVSLAIALLLTLVSVT